MMKPYAPSSEAWALLDAACNNTLTSDDVVHLEAMLRADPQFVDIYLDYFRIHAEISRTVHLEHAVQCVSHNMTKSLSDAQYEQTISEATTTESVPFDVPVIIDTTPAPNPPRFTLHSPFGSFVLSHIAAAIILGIGLLLGLVWRISLPSPEGAMPDHRHIVAAEKIGRITALSDCQWHKEGSGGRNQGSGISKTVLLGDRFHLVSGLMQITYNAGAKVILQGPCTYEIDASDGGYLAVGRLTALVEKKAKESSPQSLIPNPLFAVRTPTAVVTDLGTEFGVEVEMSGTTRSHVFQGSVSIVPTPNERGLAHEGENSRRLTTSGKSLEILHAGESARIERGQNRKVAITRELGQPNRFIRNLPYPKTQITNRKSSAPLAPRPWPRYRLTDLGTLGGHRSLAIAINDRGHVVGMSHTASGFQHAFLYSHGKMTDLDSIGKSDSYAYGINSHGEIVGSFGRSANRSGDKAFLYVDGKMTDLGSLGRSGACARCINDAGQIVGAALTGSGAEHAFLFSREGGMKDLGALDGPDASSHARAINASGQVVGESVMRNGKVHAFLWTPSTGMKDLGTLGGSEAWAMNINDAGTIVGGSRMPDEKLCAFICHDGLGMKICSTLMPGRVHANAAINNAGDVVVGAESQTALRGGVYGRALLMRGGKEIDLNSLIDGAAGQVVFYVNDINNAGQIIGKSQTPDGKFRAVLLTPMEERGVKD